MLAGLNAEILSLFLATQGLDTTPILLSYFIQYQYEIPLISQIVYLQYFCQCIHCVERHVQKQLCMVFWTSNVRPQPTGRHNTDFACLDGMKLLVFLPAIAAIAACHCLLLLLLLPAIACHCCIAV